MQGSTAIQPLVSIGIPVYNGQNYLREAIESVLKQDYSNFELIISDNGSTDDTFAICKNYLGKDKRIRYHQFDKNCGASKNYNKTFELANGEYFKWLAHDDMLSPDNLTKSVEILKSDDSVVMCGSAKKNLNSSGEIIDLFDYAGLELVQNDTLSRFKSLLKHFKHTFADADLILTGLMRSDIMKQTILIANYTSADFTLLADLILKGKFIILNEPLYLRRLHHGTSMSVHNTNPEEALKIDPSEKIVYKSHSEVAKWYDPNGKVRRIPHLTWLDELLKSINKNDFKRSERMKLRIMSFRWFVTRFSKSVVDKLKK